MSKARAHVRLRPNLPRPVDSPRPAEREAEAHQRQVSPPRHTRSLSGATLDLPCFSPKYSAAREARPLGAGGRPILPAKPRAPMVAEAPSSRVSPESAGARSPPLPPVARSPSGSPPPLRMAGLAAW